MSDVIDQNVTGQQMMSRKHSWKHSAFQFIGNDLHKVDRTALVTINGAVSMLTKAWLKYRTFIVAIAQAETTRNAYTLQYEATMRPTVSKLDITTHGRRSVGDVGDASPPLFSLGGQHRNCPPPPHFSAQKNCEAYSLTHHSSLLKAATQD